MASHNPTSADSARTPLIRPTPLNSDEDTGIDLRKLVPAWIFSGIIHVVIFSICLLVTFSGSQWVIGQDQVVVSDVDDESKDREVPLDVESIGDDPTMEVNYPIERLGEESMPGIVRPNELVGILNGRLDQPPTSVSAPPGLGNTGSGGPLDNLKLPGNASPVGEPGGWGGRFVPGGTDGRSAVTKQKMLAQNGGTGKSEAAVAKGLKWIIRHQALDGHWGMNDFSAHGKCNCGSPGGHYDAAGTAFGLLPLLGAGVTHKGSAGNRIDPKVVERGIKWLIIHQGADGSFSGNGYEHALATIAMCEDYGMTADPILKGPAQRAIACCVAWQHTAGGFRYSPRIPGDLSVHGWFVQALKSGYLAGLTVPNATWAGVNNFLDSVSTPDGSGYGYQQPQPAPTMTAVGLLCRQYMGWGPRSPGLSKGSEFLLKLPPTPNFRNMYYYYYATQVMYHLSAVNPEGWKQWNDKMRDMLIESQDQGLNADRRDQKGSWSGDGDAWCGANQMGRLGYTSLCLLTLEVYYRHLPLYRKELGAMKDPAGLN
jgi:hypothetical protein